MTTSQQAADIEVVRSEERLTVATRPEVTGRTRIAKRIVTEERLVTVTVRREELVVEHLPDVADQQENASSDGSREGVRTAGAAPVVELILSEEEVEVVTRIVPRERVRVFVDSIETSIDISEELAREVVEVDGVDGSGTPRG